MNAEEQAMLLESTVAIVGLGCTGCAVAEFLARAGVGGFVLVDGDHFDETNLNRQLYAKVSTIGQNKAIVAKNSILDINPEARVIAHAVFMDATNAAGFLANSNLVVNGLDDPYSMAILHRAAKSQAKPSVFLLSGCIPFQGICTTIPSNGNVDYETLMGLPSVGKPLEPVTEIKQQLFEQVTRARVHSALRRGAIRGEWVEQRLGGLPPGPVPSFGATSNAIAIIAALEAIKTLIRRPDLAPVCAPDMIFFDAALSQMTIQKPKAGSYWFQGDF